MKHSLKLVIIIVVNSAGMIMAVGEFKLSLLIA